MFISLRQMIYGGKNKIHLYFMIYMNCGYWGILQQDSVIEYSLILLSSNPILYNGIYDIWQGISGSTGDEYYMSNKRVEGVL